MGDDPMQPLLRKAGDFSTADSVFNQVKSVELLILDDFGTTQNSARNLDLMFELIDARARSGLPLIVTTNLAPETLNTDDIELKRIYSRIKAMCCTCEKSPVRMIGSRPPRAERQRRASGRLKNRSTGMQISPGATSAPGEGRYSGISAVKSSQVR